MTISTPPLYVYNYALNLFVGFHIYVSNISSVEVAKVHEITFRRKRK